MKRIKKWSSILLSLTLLVGLTSCASTDPATPQSTASAASSATSEASAASGESAPAPSYEKRLTVSIANVAPIEGYDYTAGDAYAKFWSERYNVDIEMAGLTWENWNEMLRIWISSQDMPDMCVFNYTTTTHADAASFADQGLLKKMPDDWRTRWPNAASVFDKTTLGPQLEKTYGGVYFLPRARFDTNLPGDPLPNHMSLFLRKDWANSVGFPVKDSYKISEIIEYGKLIKEKDPGKVGAKLVPLSMKPEYAMRTFVGHNSTYYDTFYKDASGKYQWGFANDETLQGLKLYYEAFSTGVLNPEFYSVMNEDDHDAFRITGVAGAAYMGGTATGMQVDMVQKFESSTGLSRNDAIQVANVLAEDGNYHQRDLINYWGTLVFNPDIDEDKFTRLMDWIDYGCTEEGYRIQVAGFEGEDYEMKDGQMASLLPEGMTLESPTGKYPSIGGYNLCNLKLWDDFSFDNPIILPEIRQLSKDLYAGKVKSGTAESFPATDWTVFCHDSPARRKVSYDYAVECANLITNSTSAEDLESKWRAWVDSQMPMVQPVLDELNAK